MKRHSSFLSFLYESSGNLQFRIKEFFGVQPKFEGEYFDEEGFKKISDFKNTLEDKNQTLVVIFYEYNKTNFSEKASTLCEDNNISCIDDVYSFFSRIKEGEEIYAVDGGILLNIQTKLLLKEEGIANFIKKNSFFLK